MGVYDFNIPRYNIDGVIDALRKELQSIVINSQTSIDEIKQRIADDEVILNRLKDAVNNLPDYSAQYNELYEEMARIKIALQDLIDHPIVLEDIQVGLTTEVQKINGQYLYANHAVSAINDFSGRNIVDTYATKDELSGYISGAFNEISAVSSELTDIIVNFSADTNDKFNNIENILTEKTDYLSGAIDSISGIVDTELDNLAYKIDTVSGELKSDIEAVDNKIDNVSAELEDSIDTVDNKIDAVSAELEDSIDTVDNKIDAVSANVDEKYEEISATIDTVSANFDNIFDNLNYKIDQEINRASEIEQTIVDNLTGEVTRAQTREDELDEKIGNEKDRATNAEEILGQSITDETTRALTAENALSAGLTAEVSRSTNRDDLLQQNIDTLSNSLNEKESELNDKIDVETERATAAETDIEEALSAETIHRTTADADLQAQINAVSASTRIELDSVISAINAEEERAISAEDLLDDKIDYSVDVLNDTISDLSATLSQALDQEITDRTREDSNLQSNITDEATARTEADTLLRADLEDEISARFDADALLQSNLDDEISARFTADTLLQSNIHDEEVARISADNNLQAQIDTIEATQNIVDIVGTKADLDNYDTRNLKDGAKIQVLDDETQNHASTIYQFNKYAVPEPSFGLVGTFGSYYTKSETDTKINTAKNDLTELLNIETSARFDADTTLSNRIDTLDLAKQDNLTAGDGIDITNDVVSHSVKVIENNNEEDTVDGTVFTVYLKNNHYKVITISKTITEIIFMIEKTASGVLQETGFEFTVPEDSDLETLTFKVIDDNNKKIYTIIPDSYTSPNIYQGTIVNYRCTIGEYEVED